MTTSRRLALQSSGVPSGNDWPSHDRGCGRRGRRLVEVVRGEEDRGALVRAAGVPRPTWAPTLRVEPVVGSSGRAAGRGMSRAPRRRGGRGRGEDLALAGGELGQLERLDQLVGGRGRRPLPMPYIGPAWAQLLAGCPRPSGTALGSTRRRRNLLLLGAGRRRATVAGQVGCDERRQHARWWSAGRRWGRGSRRSRGGVPRGRTREPPRRGPCGCRRRSARSRDHERPGPWQRGPSGGGGGPVLPL